MKMKYIVSVLLLVITFCLSALADIDRLRSQQERDLEMLARKYNKKASDNWGKPDGTVDSDHPDYKKLEERYRKQAESIREKYRQMDGRKKELKRIKDEFGGEIDVSGSDPKDVRSDVDLTAKSNKAADDLARQWRDAGHDVIYDKKTGKYYDKTTDTTLWKPTNKSRAKHRAKDPDAFDTMGGKKAAGVKGKEAMSDAWGNQVDNKKKFDHARGQNPDLKTQGKSVSKAAQNVGHKSEVTKQADDLRNYRSTDEAGVTKLGESKQVKERKVKEWQKKAETELEITHKKAERKSELQKDVRKKLADQADRTSKNTLDPKNKGTGDEVRKRSKKLDQSNERVKRKKAAQQQDTTPAKPSDPPPPNDGPDGSSRQDDAGSKRTKDSSELPEKSRKSDNLPEKSIKNTENSQKTRKNDDFSPKTSEKRIETQPDAPKRTKTDTEVPDVRKKSIPDADTPSRTRQPDVDAPTKTRQPDVDAPGGRTGSKAMGVADGVGDVIDAIDKGTTYVEGAMEGDTSKMSSPIVGNDTAERTRGKNAQKWADEEDKAQKSRGDEVRQELKAKLRRKGATATEAEDALKKRDAGDHKGFRDDVQKIKAKGIEDTDKRGLTPDGELQEEDGLGERLTEGAKQTGRYIDAIFGGINERTENSVEQRNEHDNDNDGLVDDVQEDVESQQVRKLMRKGISRKDAEKAIQMKNEGDRSMYDDLRDSVQDKEDDGQEGHGLDADGRTSSYEFGDYVEDAKDNIKTGAENTGAIILKPVDMYHKHHEKKHLDQSKKATDDQAEDVKNRMIESGVDVDEAEKAGKEFSDGKFGSSRDLLSKKEAEIAKKLQDVHGASEDDAKKAAKDWVQGNKKTAKDLRDRMAEKREAKAEAESESTEEDIEDEDEEDEAEDIVDNLFDDLEDIIEDEEEEEDDWDDMWADDEEEEDDPDDSNSLRRNEGHADTDDDYDWDDEDDEDLLDDMIGGMEKDRYEFTRDQMDFNQKQQDIQTASVTGQGQIDAANQQVDAANDEAVVSQGETIASVNDTDRGESWGSAIGDGMVDGVTSGAAAIGAAIASGINASTYGDNNNNDSSSSSEGEETSSGETTGEGEQVATTSSGGGGGEQRSATGGGGGEAPSEPQTPPSSGGGGQQQASAPASSGPSGPIYCPKCGGTRFGPYQKVYGPNGQSANDRKCLTCGGMGGVYGRPPASLGSKNNNRPRPTPTPSRSRASSGSTCPFCGKSTFRLSGRDGSLNVYKCSSCGGSTARNSGGGGGWARPPK